jgi:linoleoyl-CoA desaturase
MATPKFLQGQGNFYSALKQRVNQYFIEKKKQSTGNASLIFKAILLFSTYIFLYINVVFFTPIWWVAILECVLFGVLTAVIGFNIMHDGGHGSFSKSKFLNKLAGGSINVLGASAVMWHQKHNIIHHTYTNIDGVDDDLSVGPWLRMAFTQKKRWIHKYQHYYVWFLYLMPYLMLLFVTDYDKYFNKKIGSVPIRKLTAKEHINFWLAKVLYAFMIIALPIYLLGFFTWLKIR